MSSNLRFYYWLVTGFFAKHKKVIGVAILAGAILFSQLPNLLSLMPKPKPTIYVGRVGSYSLANLPRDIQLKISQGLTTVDESGKAVPALAKDWQVIDEGKTYIFNLRTDIVWQDGSPINAFDVDYTIADVDIEVRDDYTLIYRLKEPFAPFPAILSQPLFKRQQRSVLQVIETTQIVGTGDYVLSQIKFNGSNIDYLVLESQHEKLVYRFYNTERAAILGFQLAEVDRLEELSELGPLADWDTIEIESSTSPHQYAVVYFNVTDANLTEKRIRQALAYMTPKSEEPGKRALSPISSASWAYNPSVKPYSFSFDTAKQLMEGLKTDFEIELTTTPNFLVLAESIKASWEQLGPKVNIKLVNLPDTNNYQALLIGQQIPHDPDQYILWHSTQEGNITRYESPKVDKLLEDGRKELDDQERREIYLNFQRFLVEDTPAVFLHYLETYTVRR